MTHLTSEGIENRSMKIYEDTDDDSIIEDYSDDPMDIGSHYPARIILSNINLCKIVYPRDQVLYPNRKAKRKIMREKRRMKRKKSNR